MNFEARLPGLNPGSDPNTWQFWANNLTSLCLSCLFYKMSMQMIPTSQDYSWEINMYFHVKYTEQCLAQGKLSTMLLLLLLFNI